MPDWVQTETFRTFRELRNLISTIQVGVGIIVVLGVACRFIDPVKNLTLLVMFTLIIGLCWKVDKNSVKFQKFFVIFFCEYLTISNLVMQNELFPGQSLELMITSTLFLIIFEIKVIHNKAILFALLLKHALLWFGQNLVRTITESPREIPASYCAFIFVYLVYSNEKARKEESFNLYRKKTKLENMRKRLSVLIENMPGGLILLSSSFEVVLKNINILSIFQTDYVLEAIRTLEYSQGRRFYFRDSENLLFGDIKRCFELELNQEVTLGITLYDHSYLEWKAKKVEWGSEHALILIVKNVDEIIKYEQVSSENRCKNAILRSVSHELRTPTNSICCLTDKLIEQELEPEVYQNLQIIKISSNLLLSLINDLLDYSRMLAGVFNIEKTEFIISKAIEEVVKLVEVQAAKKGVRVLSRIDSLVPEVGFSDDKRFRQVMLNLLSNAVKFTFKGEIEVCLWMNCRNKLSISVKDSGIGIPLERQTQLFRLFSRVHASEVSAEGCGLGLHISNLLVKELGGGHIQVKSRQGAGSVFSFEIEIFRESSPLEYDLEFSDNEEIYSPVRVYEFCTNVKSERKVEVLVVDDESFNRHIVVTVLKSLNISIAEAYNGKQAVEKVKQFDKVGSSLKVVIMDCSMPEMNGWEATEAIKTMHTNKEIAQMPVVLGYTAFTGATETAECYRSGMTKVLSKPVNAEILLKTVASFLY